MPAILRKSLTACEALAALPPTPRMNRRPPRSRVCSSNAAIRSMAWTSRPSMTRLASSRNWAACDMVLSSRARGPSIPPGQVGAGLLEPRDRADLVEAFGHLEPGQLVAPEHLLVDRR